MNTLKVNRKLLPIQSLPVSSVAQVSNKGNQIMTAYIYCIGEKPIANPGDPFSWAKGYIIGIYDTNQIIPGSKQVPPNFFQIEVTDANPTELLTYADEWMRFIDYEFIGHDYVIDGHRLRVFTDRSLVSASGLNGLTQAIVSNYLTKWRCSIVSSAFNEIIFDSVIYEAICSDGFWNTNDILLRVSFSETSYNQSTGIHVIEANYINDPFLSSKDKAWIENYITQRGGIITSHPTNRINFEISRTSIFDWFKADVKMKVDGPAFRRRFYFGQGVVDQALANNGTLIATKAQVISYILNRINE